MFPLFPFAAGLLAGVFAVRVARSAKPQAGLGKAKERLRDVTVSGLAAIEQSSAGLRAKLEPKPAAPVKKAARASAPRTARKKAAASGAPMTAVAAEAPVRKPRKKAAPAAAAPKPEGGA